MKKILLLFFILSIHSVLYAQNSPGAKELFPPLQLQFFLGYQGLRSHEYVLGDGNSQGHISELIWNSFKNLLFGANISGHHKRLHYLMQVSSTLSLDQNYIYDYDWLYTGSIAKDAASNYSRHDTEQKLQLEALLRMGFSIFEKEDSKITLGPGLFFSFNEWRATDGELRYLGVPRESSGRILNYVVVLFAPQVYLQFIHNFSRMLELHLSVAYSPLTMWFDRDNHYKRNLLFLDYGFLGQQIFGELQVNFWNKRRNFAVGVGISGRYLFETRGGTEEFSADDDGKPKDKNSSSNSSAGIEQGSVQVYLGVTFAFLRLGKKNLYWERKIWKSPELPSRVPGASGASGSEIFVKSPSG